MRSRIKRFIPGVKIIVVYAKFTAKFYFSKGENKMISKSERDRLVAEFHEGVEKNLKENMENVKLVEYCKNGDKDAVKQVCEKVRANICSAIPEGYSIPKAVMHVTCTGTGADVTVISVSLMNGIKDEKKFKFSIAIPVAEDIQSKLVNFFKAAYDQRVMEKFVEENIDGVNTLLDELTERAGVSYKVHVVSPLNRQGRKIAFISDDEVEFVVDLENIFDVEDILVFQEVDGDVITEEKLEGAKEALANEIGLIQTTVKLVDAHGGSLLKILCNIGTQVKAMSLIRKVNPKNVECLRGTNDTCAYYEKDGVYAVLSRQDGILNVILKPFDVKTLDPVDVDVLAKINA